MRHALQPLREISGIFARSAWHFGSRAGLLKAVLADVDERGNAQGSVERILAAGDSRAVIHDLVAWWAEYVAGFAGIARSVNAGCATDPALAAAWADRMDALPGVCRLVVAACGSSTGSK